MSRVLPPRVCPACRIPPIRSWRLANGEILLRCPRCGLGWWNWPAFEPELFYDADYFQSGRAAKGYDDYERLSAGLRRTARGRLARLARVLALNPAKTAGDAVRPPRLLDVGCGTGHFLDEARRAGWQTAGVEVSVYAAQRARERGHDVMTAAVEGLSLSPGAYDCIAAWDVLEHVRDPAGMLAAMVSGVRPGGVVALSTGDLASLAARLCGARWHLFNLPEHLFFFTAAALNKLVGQAGGRMVEIAREVNWLPVSYLAERLRKSLGGAYAQADGARERSAAGHDAVLVADRPLGLLGRLALPATLLDILGVYAVRPR